MIDTQDELERLVARLADQPALAIDCEMDSLYAYRTSLCLVQVGWPGGEALIDGLAPLDRSSLGSLFQDPDVVKVFHSGENDIGLMTDRWGMEFGGVFDTMAASQILGHKGVGLAAVLERHFGVKLSKKYQKADWRVRPLPEDQAEYARLDVRYLLSLRELLLAELDELGRIEEAECDFARIARVRIEEKPFDPESWVRVKGSRDLGAELRGIVRELYIVRNTLSERMDRAPYRVLHDRAIVMLATSRPATIEAYRKVSHVNRRLGSQDVRMLLDAIDRGREAGAIPYPKRRERPPWDPSSDRRLQPEEEQRLDQLRAWRTKRAAERGVEVARIATTALLAQIARAVPRTLDELLAVEGVDDWRVREYGDEILDVLKKNGSA